MADEKNKKNEKDIEKGLNDFLDKPQIECECEGEECIINDGKEIVERVNKVYKTTDGRQLLM